MANADADGRVYARGAHDRMHLLEQGELFGLHRGQPALLKDKHIPVSVVAAQEAVLAVAPLGYHILNGVAQIVLYPVGVVFHQLVVVVDDDGGYDGAGVLILYAYVVILCDVHPVSNAHVSVARLGVLFGGADDVAVYLVLPSAYREQAGILGLALKQPLSAEGRHQLVQPRLKAGTGHAAHIEKYLICPDDARVVERKHRHWQRKIEQRVVLRRVCIVGHGLDVLH